jgi:hypothetical protein
MRNKLYLLTEMQCMWVVEAKVISVIGAKGRKLIAHHLKTVV